MKTAAKVKIIKHGRHADRVMRVEGTLAVGGTVGGVLLWAQAPHLGTFWGGYGFALAAFLSLGGIQAGIRALCDFNRWARGAAGEEAVLHTLRGLPDGFAVVANFVVPGTRAGDADLLVLGPMGVLVLEVKACRGRLACRGDVWFTVGSDGERRATRGSASRQVKRARKAVAHYLVDCDLCLPVCAAVVFRPGASLELVQPTVPILGQEDLLAHILALPPAPRPVCLSALEPLFAPALRVPAPRTAEA